MRNYGLLLNFLVVFVSSLFYFVVAGRVFLKSREGPPVSRHGTRNFFAFLFLVALGLLFLSLRNLAAFFGLTDLDKILFYLDNIAPAFTTAILVFMVIYIFTSEVNTSLGISHIFTFLGILYLYLLYTGGVEDYKVSFWATEWVPVSKFSISLFLFGLFLPGLIASIFLSLASIRIESKDIRFRICMTSFSCSLFYLIALLDVLAFFSGGILLIARLGFLLAAMAGYFAYFPPPFLRRRFGLSEPEKV